MSTFYLKICDIAKQHWWVILFVSASAVAGFFLAKSIYEPKFNFDDKVRDIEAAHERRIAKIIAAHEEAERQHSENLQELQENLDIVHAMYDEAQTKLDEKKKKIYIDVVQKYGSDTEGLAKKFSEVSGIPMYHGVK